MADQPTIGIQQQPSRGPNDGLAAAQLRIDELEACHKILQDTVQSAIGQIEQLEERLTAALNGLASQVENLKSKTCQTATAAGEGDGVILQKLDELRTTIDLLDAAVDGLSDRVVKLEGM